MPASQPDVIATRHLLYSLPGEEERRALTVCITAPELLTEGSVAFRFDPGAASCEIRFEGLPEETVVVFGADRIQALALATDIDPYLRGLSGNYHIYWESGDDYFDEVAR